MHETSSRPAEDYAAAPLPPLPLSRYRAVWAAFLRNALVRDLSFRGNFLITAATRAIWFLAQLALFEIIYRSVPEISGWSRYEYYVFMGTVMLVNSVIETLFMPNCARFSELIRTGELDFVLLRPVDPQFIVSLERVELPNLSQAALALALIVYSLAELGRWPSAGAVLGWCGLVVASVGFFYSLMLVLASTSVFFVRNTGLYDFWFYVTVFGRYPRAIYESAATRSALAEGILVGFTFAVPILLAVTVPAEVLLERPVAARYVWAFLGLTAVSLFASRRVFLWALTRYRSASS
jgi:ABC-2 type transport system permease protein